MDKMQGLKLILDFCQTLYGQYTSRSGGLPHPVPKQRPFGMLWSMFWFAAQRLHLTPVLRNLCAAMVDYCHMTFNKNWCSLYNNLSTWIFAVIFALTPVSHNWGPIRGFIILKVGSFGIKHDVLLLNWHSIHHLKFVSARCL